MNGMYKIGYSINREYRFPLKYKGCNVIGAYGASFNKRAMFQYRTATYCVGYFIRKQNWDKIVNDDSNREMCEIFKKAARMNYINKVKSVLLECKEFEVRKL